MKQALEGITVLDVGQLVQGPQAAATLAFMGADVIKIELPHLFDGPERVPDGDVDAGGHPTEDRGDQRNRTEGNGGNEQAARRFRSGKDGHKRQHGGDHEYGHHQFIEVIEPAETANP